MKKNNIEFNDYIENLSNDIDEIIKNNIFDSIEDKQKIYALSSFIEFLKAGASVEVAPINNRKISFNFNLE